VLIVFIYFCVFVVYAHNDTCSLLRLTRDKCAANVL